MCRSIKNLRIKEPSADVADIHAADLQFVRKITGYRAPSMVNREAFDQAVEEIDASSTKLLASLEFRR